VPKFGPAYILLNDGRNTVTTWTVDMAVSDHTYIRRGIGACIRLPHSRLHGPGGARMGSLRRDNRRLTRDRNAEPKHRHETES
jgi:hypothetical protein